MRPGSLTRNTAAAKGSAVPARCWWMAQPISSCIVLAAQVDGAEITTAAGLLEDDGSLGPLQRAFHEYHAAQCGFCTPGMLVSAAAAPVALAGAPIAGADPGGAAREPCAGARAMARSWMPSSAAQQDRERGERGRRSAAPRPRNCGSCTSHCHGMTSRRKSLAALVTRETSRFGSMLHARLVRSQVPSARITGGTRPQPSRCRELSASLFGEDVPHNVIWVDVPGQTVEVAALKASMEVLATEQDPLPWRARRAGRGR